MFLQFCDEHPDDKIFDQKLNTYISSIGKKYEQWQLDQAREAITLYTFFIGRKTPTISKKDRDWNADWVKAGEMM